MKNLVRLLICSLPLLILAACGSGGGSPSTQAATGSAPVVLSVTPANLAVGVSPTASVKVTFSDAMDPATVIPSTTITPAGVTDGTFTISYVGTTHSFNAFNNLTTVTKLTVVPGTVSVDSTHKIFTFTPHDPNNPINPNSFIPYDFDEHLEATLATHQPRTFKVTIKGGANGVKKADTTAMLVDKISNFTIWAGTQTAGTLNDEVYFGTAADADGNIYSAGYTNGSMGAATNTDGSGLTSDVLVNSYDANGLAGWTSQLGSPSYINPATQQVTNYNDKAYSMALDSATGAVVVAGYTDGTINQLSQANPAQANPDLTGATHNYLIAKFDAGSGSLMWATQAGAGPLGAAVSSVAYGVSTDAIGNVYVTGTTYGDLRSSGAGAFTASFNKAVTHSALFVSKYDSGGNLQWTKVFGTGTVTATSDETGFGIAVDRNSLDPNHPNVYVTGTTTGSFNGGTYSGGKDIFLAKLDNNGVVLWSVEFGTPNDDNANTMTCDASGFVTLVGGTRGSLAGTNPDATGNTNNIIVARFDQLGHLSWWKQILTAFDAEAYGVTTDSLGAVFVTGRANGSMPGNVGSGGPDIFAIKYDRDGNQLWTTQLGSGQTDAGVAVGIWVPDPAGPNAGTLLNPAEYLFVAGYTYGDLDTNFNMNGGAATLIYDTSDAFIAKFDAVTGAKF